MNWRLAPCAVLLASCAVTACSSAPRLDAPERFYLHEPTVTEFTYERAWDDGSRFAGTLTVAVDAVEEASGPDGTYRMAGTFALDYEASLTSRLAARAAPREIVTAAMEPDNVDEVFEVRASQPGVTITRLHWDRLRSLRLPLEFRHEVPPTSFDSALRGDVLSHPAEVALVWHKVLAPALEVPPFGRFDAHDVDEREDTLTLTLAHELGAGTPLAFRYEFERGRGLVGVTVELDDGSRLTLRAVDG